MTEPLLKVKGLYTQFDTFDGIVKAVNGISFAIREGETFALVGESGCGKSVTSFSILQLIPCPPGKITAGSIEFQGLDLLTLSEQQMQSFRGSQISMVFQEPMSSLNPVFTCGNQIVEAIRLHQKVSPAKAKEIAIQMLKKVGIPAPEQRFNEYPHQMSGGMKQRVMIAIALCCNPKLLIADEPTTALDVTIQSQILDLLKDIQRTDGLAVLLITHDLGVVAETAHRVGVMYASKMVEQTTAQELFTNPQHPYTRGLFKSLPKLGEKEARLHTIPGNVPNPLSFPTGCKFHPRCELGGNDRQCQTEEPPLREISAGHWCACWKAENYENGKATDPADIFS